MGRVNLGRGKGLSRAKEGVREFFQDGDYQLYLGLVAGAG